MSDCDGEDLRGYVCSWCLTDQAIEGEELCRSCKRSLTTEAPKDEDEQGDSP